ncbi:hypothetical protein [Dyadobacter sp. LHD-138]|uniref:hypothetical protein n=1 Tax=Dyadobacter sp. LHD-138 TaxID=3071413 RepID=UPI0027DF99E0|nr:hypothetical protein [Dyadobacter sp. LHD-138]MDQ6482543.1 hypothetical protein [Dyadobacter sp. LHD-138]
MKTYKTVLRAVLMLVTIFLLLIGALSSYQNWSHSKNIMGIGLMLFMVMIADHYISKRILAKREKDS